MNDCILFVAHEINSKNILQYLYWKKSGKKTYWIINRSNIYNPSNLIYTNVYNYINEIDFIFISSVNDLKEKYKKISYTLKYSLFTGEFEFLNYGSNFNTVLNIVETYNIIPKYDYYWIIEFDVKFNNSDCNYFFNIFNNKSDDLLCCNLLNLKMNMNRYISYIYDYSVTLKLNKFTNKYLYLRSIKLSDLYRGFLPIYRISNKLLYLLFDFYLTLFGFMELVVPTVAHCNNLIMHDFQYYDENIYISEKDITRNKYKKYSKAYKVPNIGSMTFTQQFFLDFPETVNINNILIHPIKK